MYLNILQSPAISHEKTRDPSKLPSPDFTSIKASLCYNSIPFSHSPSLSVDSPLPFPCSMFPLPLGRFPLFPLPLGRFPSRFLSFPFPCSLSLSVSLMPLFPVGFPVFPLCFSRHLCTKKQILKKKKQDKDSRGNRAPPSQFSSLSPPATIQKQREQGLIFNASTRDMVAGSGDGVTGRGCFLLGKID